MDKQIISCLLYEEIMPGVIFLPVVTCTSIAFSILCFTTNQDVKTKCTAGN